MTELELKLTRALADMVGQYCAATPDLDNNVTADFNCMSCDEKAIELLFDMGLATPQGKRRRGVAENTFLGGVHRLEIGKLDEIVTEAIHICRHAGYAATICTHWGNILGYCTSSLCPVADTNHIEESEDM